MHKISLPNAREAEGSRLRGGFSFDDISGGEDSETWDPNPVPKPKGKKRRVPSTTQKKPAKRRRTKLDAALDHEILTDDINSRVQGLKHPDTRLQDANDNLPGLLEDLEAAAAAMALANKTYRASEAHLPNDPATKLLDADVSTIAQQYCDSLRDRMTATADVRHPPATDSSEGEKDERIKALERELAKTKELLGKKNSDFSSLEDKCSRSEDLVRRLNDQRERNDEALEAKRLWLKEREANVRRGLDNIAEKQKEYDDRVSQLVDWQRTTQQAGRQDEKQIAVLDDALDALRSPLDLLGPPATYKSVRQHPEPNSGQEATASGEARRSFQDHNRESEDEQSVHQNRNRWMIQREQSRGEYFPEPFSNQSAASRASASNSNVERQRTVSSRRDGAALEEARAGFQDHVPEIEDEVSASQDPRRQEDDRTHEPRGLTLGQENRKRRIDYVELSSQSASNEEIVVRRRGRPRVGEAPHQPSAAGRRLAVVLPTPARTCTVLQWDVEDVRRPGFRCTLVPLAIVRDIQRQIGRWDELRSDWYQGSLSGLPKCAERWASRAKSVLRSHHACTFCIQHRIVCVKMEDGKLEPLPLPRELRGRFGRDHVGHWRVVEE